MNPLIASTFGSEAGGWSYPYIQPLSTGTFLTAFLLTPILLLLAYFSGRRVAEHECKVVGVWMVIGFAAQVWLRSLAPFSMGDIIESPGAFFLTHLLLVGTLGFNILDAFFNALEDARAFNINANRPYFIWTIQNLKDFFLNMGIAHSLLFLLFLGGTLWKLATLIGHRTGTAHPIADYLTKSDVVLLLAFTCVLLVLDLLGINRGETTRLWIFLGVILQIVVAHYCAVGRQYRAFAPVLAITIIQTSLCLSRVGFVVP